MKNNNAILNQLLKDGWSKDYVDFALTGKDGQVSHCRMLTMRGLFKQLNEIVNEKIKAENNGAY